MRYVLKIGGSVLTDKTSRNTLSENFSEVLSKVEPGGVLVHGAGSYGHPQAREQQLNDGIEEGYLKPHNAVKQLNRQVVNELKENGLKPVPVHSSSIAYRENGETRINLETVRKAVEQGFTPVLHGDMIIEDSGFSVISGDELVALIEKEFETGNAGFCTSAEGVLDRGKQVLEKVDSLEKVHDHGSEGEDVTNGIKGKIKQILDNDVEARIFGLEELENFFDHEAVGTLVQKPSSDSSSD